MAFDPFETGDGSPVELITFQNGSIIIRSTNAVRPITIGSHVFEPLAYTLTPFAQSKDSDDTNRTLTTHKDYPAVDLYSGPLRSAFTLCTIERYHVDDTALQTQVLWKGRVVAINHVDNDVDILLQPSSSGKESTPPDTFSALCNAFLFDTPGCRLFRDDWRHVGTVSALANNDRNLTINGLRTRAAALDTAQGGPTGPLTSDELDIYWQNGYIRTGAGEVRSIIEGNVGSDSDVVRVDIAFRDLAVTDGVSVYAGCNLLRETCHKKFDNVINFQGFPDIPEIDPANTELPPGTRTSPSKFAGPQ